MRVLPGTNAAVSLEPQSAPSDLLESSTRIRTKRAVGDLSDLDYAFELASSMSDALDDILAFESSTIRREGAAQS